MQGEKIAMDKADRLWLMHIIKRVRLQYMEESDLLEDDEEADTSYQPFPKLRKTGIEIARMRYPVVRGRELTTNTADKIMEYVKALNTVGNFRPQCDYFCKYLGLWEMKTNNKYKAPPLVREVLCDMILAVSGCQERGGNRSRGVKVVERIRGPVVTDAYVGVCCKSLKKLCQNVKSHMLENSNSGTLRDATLDGWVHPQYDRYPDNGAVCANIVRPDWNPPVNVVEKWVSLCLAKMVQDPAHCRAVCLKTLRLDEGEEVMDQLQSYVDDTQDEIWNIAATNKPQPLWQHVDTIVLPVKLPGAWILYLTQRSIKLQSLVRIAKSFRWMGNTNRDVPMAVYNLDQIMHTLGRNAMAYWLKMLLLTDLKGTGPAVEYSRVKAEQDMRAEYTILPEQPLIASTLTPGTMVMYLLQGVLTANKRSLGDIKDAHEKLDTAASRGLEAVATNCRTKMQLAFAVNSHVGMCIGEEAPTDTATHYSEDSSEMASRRRPGPVHRPEAVDEEEEEEEGRGREPRPPKGSKSKRKRDDKERVKETERKDRKKDHRRDRRWYRK